MQIVFQKPNEADFAIVKKYIAEFKLDDADIFPEQFLVAKVDDKVAAFGRLKNYDGVVELGTLGVLPEFQEKNIGKQITSSLPC